ncbi:MAG: hypothetical protein A2049_00950 [Elusimicrobia bacterium GWA2_62_23]|nr:MAG: hypothetical protein A2049_00950 [Elusimicrobia bacterium GWA2_62_23]
MKNNPAPLIIALTLLQCCYGLSHAAIWGRGKLPAPRHQTQITVDGRLSDWPAGETYDSSGLRFRAINDGNNLYLSVSAHEAGAKAILTGEIRQDVALWFSDGESRTLGLRLPFGALGVPVEGIGPGAIEPVLLKPEGTAVSTSTLPAGMEFGGEIPGRVPIYELKIPLAMLKTGRNSIRLDFMTSYVSAELEQRMKERFTQAAGQRAAGQHGAEGGMRPQGGMAGRGGGKMGGGKRGGGGRGAGRAQPEFPSPLEISLTILPDAKP